jgi:hypothetical protein
MNNREFIRRGFKEFIMDMHVGPDGFRIAKRAAVGRLANDDLGIFE